MLYKNGKRARDLKDFFNFDFIFYALYFEGVFNKTIIALALEGMK